MRIDENAGSLSFWESIDSSAHEFLGAHKEKGKWVFRVWAPNAKGVFVTGDFCKWDEAAYPMRKISDNGIWEAVVKDGARFDSYKYVIITKDSKKLYKADPYATHFSTRPETDSKIFDISGYRWKDKEWMLRRKNGNLFKSPFNIYEVQLGSWRRYGDGNFFDYKKLAGEIIKYVKKMGYTHIELMPVAEYPFDGSWGYQVTGYFAPTSRFGTPYGFMEFVEMFHLAGIGVILDWVPAHFPKDECGLFQFDGGFVYEYGDPLKREHADWGTCIFDYGKREVASLLISSAVNWAKNYHIDGLRVDAVASMLYLDYGKQSGEWRPNQYGNNINLEAVEFLKKFNTELHLIPGFVTIAEESTAYAAVTLPVDAGGLGFDFKWNMGWMNDSLRYLGMDAAARRDNQSLLSFSTSYRLSENYILPLSHDEVVHGKRALVEKAPGDERQRFFQLSAYMMYMYAHPGKKLLFMCADIAQQSEWDEKCEIAWGGLGRALNQQFNQFMKKLYNFYNRYPQLWELDFYDEGFEWISADDNKNNVYAFLRKDSTGGIVVCIFNFSPNHLEKYRLGLPFAGPTGLGLYSGMFFGRTLPLSRVYSKKIPMHGREFSGEFTLPPYSGVFYTHQVAGTKKNYMFLNEKKDFLARKEKAQKEQNSYKALLAKEKKSNSQKAK